MGPFMVILASIRQCMSAGMAYTTLRQQICGWQI
uniref:Uncharacterized protein n=1 Tax=Rhizophora mucronata TaxID=61149 RepID=A0A2P2IIF2_RHIMU